MYRNVILEFLTNKHLVLSQNGYFRMTICELGCNYSDTLLKIVNKSDDVNVYNIIEPRIYQKSYDFSVLESTIIMMLIEMKTEITFNKSELSFELLDPYYLKDLQELDFSSIQITPIMENDEIVGAVIVYYNLENGKVKFTNNELIKLLNNLKNDREVDYLSIVESKIIKSNENYYLCIKGSNVYLNDLLKNKFKLSTNCVSLKDANIKKKVNTFISKHGVKKFKQDDLMVYYIEKEKTVKPKIDNDLLALYNINNHDLGEDFSYIMIRKSPLNTLSKELEVISFWLNGFNDINYKLYEYNDESLIVLLDYILSNNEVNHLAQKLDDSYIVYVTTQNGITKSMDLNKISDYLYLIQPEKFVYQEYTQYLNNLSQESLSYNGKFKLDDQMFEIVNVDNVSTLGKLHFLPLRENLRDSHFKSYSSAVLKEIAMLSKIEEDKFIINIPFSLLQKRKTLEDVKKILANNNSLTINVLYDNNANFDTFIKTISKYKKLNVLMSCDSSVYLNFYLMASIELFDFIYVQNDEYLHIISQNVGIPQAIFSYILHEYKNIIIENFSPNPDIDYDHPNCYYVKEVKNKPN